MSRLHHAFTIFAASLNENWDSSFSLASYTLSILCVPLVKTVPSCFSRDLTPLEISYFASSASGSFSSTITTCASRWQRRSVPIPSSHGRPITPLTMEPESSYRSIILSADLTWQTVAASSRPKRSPSAHSYPKMRTGLSLAISVMKS